MAVCKHPLPHSKQYHWNIIYDDNDKLSHNFVVFVVRKLEECYYTKCFYSDRDTVPGKSVFSEFFRGVESSIWTLVIVTNGFSDNCWTKYCQNAAFYNNIVKNNADKLIPIIIGNADKPVELQINTALHFDSDSRNWSDEKVFNKLQKLLEAAPLCVPLSQTTNAEITQEITGIYSTDQSQPVTDTNSSNNNSQNDQLETDSHAEVHNIVQSERQMATVSGRHLPQTGSFEAFSEHNQFDDRQNCETGSRSPSSSNVTVNNMQSNASHYESLSDDPDLSCDQLPLTMKEVHTNAANYEPTTQEQAGQNVNPNTLELRGKSLSIDSLVNSQSNEPSESTSPEQSLSALDPGFESGGGMTPAHDISTSSQKTLQREENKSDIRVGNSMTDDLEQNNTSRTDTRDNQMERLRLTGMDETQPENSINANNQERVDPVRGERPRPDGCEIDEAASDSADLKPTPHLSRWNSTIVAGGCYVLKSLINGLNRTDPFPF